MWNDLFTGEHESLVVERSTHGTTNTTDEFHPSIFNPGLPLLIVYAVALLFTIFTWVFGFWLIALHARYFTMPQHQIYIIRVLLICPLYAAYSLVALVLMQYQVYIGILRDAYEAYVLWQFFALCVNYIGGEAAVIEHLNGQQPMRLEMPLCCVHVTHWEKFYTWVKRGIIQYMVIRPLMAVVSIILEVFDLYGDGDIFNFTKGFFYVVTIQNICLTISMYCLVVFYQATTEALAPYKPLLKFISIKIILFFVFWQGVAIASILWFGWLPEFWGLPPEELSVAIQNFIVCIEMAAIAVLHIWAFPVDMYRIKAQSQAPLVHDVDVNRSALKSVAKTINQADVLKSTAEAFKLRGKRRKGRDLDVESPDGDDTDELDFGEQFKNLRQQHITDSDSAALAQNDSLAAAADENGNVPASEVVNADIAAIEAAAAAQKSSSKSLRKRIHAVLKPSSTSYETLDEPAQPEDDSAWSLSAPPSADASSSSSSSSSSSVAVSKPVEIDPSSLPPSPSGPDMPDRLAVDVDEPESDHEQEAIELANAIKLSTATREQLDDGTLFEVLDDSYLSTLPTDTDSKTAKSKARR